MRGLPAVPEVKKRAMMTNREVFRPIGLEGKEWAGWGWEECVLGRREEAGTELHPVLIGDSRAMKWGGRRGMRGILPAKTSTYSSVRNQRTSQSECWRGEDVKVTAIPPSQDPLWSSMRVLGSCPCAPLAMHKASH